MHVSSLSLSSPLTRFSFSYFLLYLVTPFSSCFFFIFFMYAFSKPILLNSFRSFNLSFPALLFLSSPVYSLLVSCSLFLVSCSLSFCLFFIHNFIFCPVSSLSLSCISHKCFIPFVIFILNLTFFPFSTSFVIFLSITLSSCLFPPFSLKEYLS